MGRSEEPDKQEEAGGDARDNGEEVPQEENVPAEDDEDDEVPELDEGFEDEREISTINDALDNIGEALDKLEEQNDQLNEQLRSILAASRRIQSGMDLVNNFGPPSTSSNH